MVDYWRYELTPKRRLSAIAAEGPRHGALIRADGGFADIHPWPELGDALAADAAGNGAPVVTMSDHYNQNGSSNGDDAALAIDCLDHPASHNLSAYSYLADLFKASAPVGGLPLLLGPHDVGRLGGIRPGDLRAEQAADFRRSAETSSRHRFGGFGHRAAIGRSSST